MIDDGIIIVTEWIFFPEQGLWCRIVLVIVGGVVVWRYGFLLFTGQLRRADAENARPWLPLWTRRSKLERLETEINVIRAETDIATSKADAARANAHLKNVLDELSAVVRRNQPADRPPPRAGLTRDELAQLLELANLSPTDRARVLELLAARDEEGRS